MRVFWSGFVSRERLTSSSYVTPSARHHSWNLLRAASPASVIGSASEKVSSVSCFFLRRSRPRSRLRCGDLVILIADARHTQTRNDTMPFVLDGLNMIFLAAAAIFGGTIIKANPDLTKPHPDSAFGKWQAKRQEKVSHETSRLPWVLPSRVATGDARARRGTRDRSRDTRVPDRCRLTRAYRPGIHAKSPSRRHTRRFLLTVHR